MVENIFRAYDIRGIYPSEINEDVARDVGKAFGTFLNGDGTVVVGRDARLSGSVLKTTFIAGLVSTGVDVLDIGLQPTPVVAHQTVKQNATAGVIISASHNPAEYNGIRFRRGGDGSGYHDCIEPVKEIFSSKNFLSAPVPGSVQSFNSFNVRQEYISELTEKITVKKPIKVMVDPGNGAACNVARDLMKQAGCKVMAINDVPDGTFPNRSPYPNENTLSDLQNNVLLSGSAVGLAYDGDADRVVVVDDLGKVRSAEDIGILLAKYMLKDKKGGNVVLNVECSMSVEDIVKDLGGKVVRIRVGDAFLAEGCKENKALFAMESSSHFVIPEIFPFDDGIAAGLYVAKILSEDNRPLSEILSDIPVYERMKKTIPCSDQKKFKVITLVSDYFKGKGYTINDIDGVKVDFDSGSVLIRASNTQPIIRVTAEARDRAVVNQIMSEVDAVLRQFL